MKVILAGALLSLPTFCPYSTGNVRNSVPKQMMQSLSAESLQEKLKQTTEYILKLDLYVESLRRRTENIEKKYKDLDALKENGELGKYPNEVKQMTSESNENHKIYPIVLKSMSELEESIRTLIEVLGIKGEFGCFEGLVPESKKIFSGELPWFSPEQNKQLNDGFYKLILLIKKLRGFTTTTDDSGKADQDIVNRLKETTEWQYVRRAQVELVVELGKAEESLDMTKKFVC